MDCQDVTKQFEGIYHSTRDWKNQFLTNSEGNENPQAHEHIVRQFKKPFGTMSSLMSTERYKKPTTNWFYCEQLHWSNECHNVSTMQERKESQRKILHMFSPRTCNGEI